MYYNCVGDCKERLIRNSIVGGLNSTKAYQQCISKESSLILNECIKICQTEDSRCRQVQALCPDSTDSTDSTSVHKLAQYLQQQGRHSFRGRGAFWGSRFKHRGSPGGTQPKGKIYRQSTKTGCEFCVSRPHKYRSECKALGQKCFYCGKLRYFSKMCKENLENQDSDKTEVKHIDIEEQSPDYAHTTPYLTNDQVKASVKCLKTTAKVHYMHNKDTEHIRPLWVAQSQGFQILHTDCEVDTGAGCNILPTHKAQ